MYLRFTMIKLRRHEEVLYLKECDISYSSLNYTAIGRAKHNENDTVTYVGHSLMIAREQLMKHT